MVTLDTPLNSIVGDSAGIPGAGDVTLRHLLTHYSGLTGPARRVELWSREAVLSSAELLATLTRAGPPGTEYRYCNACYGVLGYVVEVLTGETYGEYVAEHLLAPLGIQVNSATMPEPRIVEHMALPYNVEDGVPTPVPQVRFAGPAAGDVDLTPSTIGALLAAMLSGGMYEGTRVLNASSVSEMETAQFGSRGLGISVGDFNGHQILIHNGSIPGFKAVLIGDPVTGYGVYVAANANQGRTTRSISLLDMSCCSCGTSRLSLHPDSPLRRATDRIWPHGVVAAP